MKTNFLLLAVFSVFVLPQIRSGHYSPSFLRDAIERVTNYPFKRKPSMVIARNKDFQGNQKSYLIDYLFGSKHLPLRDAVESLPVPLLTAEERSFPAAAGRVPLRDAVEQIPKDKTLGSSRRSKSFNFEISNNTHMQYDYLDLQKINAQDYPHQLENQQSFTNGEIPFDEDAIKVSRDYEKPSLFPTTTIFHSPARNLNKLSRDKNEFEGENPNGNREYRLVCYLEGWANLRKEPLKFNTFDLDPFACTHIIYAYAGIDPHNFSIYPQNEEHDVVKGGYLSVVGLKRFNPHLKVLISIAGWSAGDSNFSKMAASAARRQKFIKSVVRFVDVYNFDGIDLDWEFPGAEDLGGSGKDREYFSLLLEELAEIFLLKNWYLSASVASSRFRIEDGYHVQEIAPYLDLINILAFDLHSEREEVADHHSPLYRRKHDQGLDIFYNADYAVKYWIKKGAPRKKLNLGVPFFGRSFTLADSQKRLPGSKISGPGKEGSFTQQSGFLAYFEICQMIAQGDWQVLEDSVGSPYTVKDDQWIGFDDTKSVLNKVNYAKKHGLGGVALYAVDLDDYRGLCGEQWLLLNTAKSALMNATNQGIFLPRLTAAESSINPVPGTIIVHPENVNCTVQGYVGDPDHCGVYHLCERGWRSSYMCPKFLHFDASLDLCNWPDLAGCRGRNDKSQLKEKSFRDEEEFKIVCYFTNWAWYRKGDGKFLPEHIDPGLCTHIIYAYASLDPNELKLKPFDVTADIDNNFFDRITQLSSRRNQNKKTAVLLAVGGWTDSTGDKYSKMVSDERSRRNFVSSSVEFLKKHRFRGLHFDWIYPKCWQSNCNKGPHSDMKNFAQLLKELNREFKKQEPPLILAAGISGYREVIDVGYDVVAISREVDFMSIMTYDYHGAWEKRTGHVSPLYYRKGDTFPRFNTNYTMEYLAAKGADRSKLLVGIPFYGQSFTLKDKSKNGYGAQTEGPGLPGEFTRQPGMLSYYEICDRVRKKKWRVSQDSQGATGPFASKDDQWVSYDDVKSVKMKANYVKSRGFGGAMAWSIDLDDFNNRCCQGSFPLLKAIGSVFGRIPDEPAGTDCAPPVPPVTPSPPVTTTGFDSGASSEHEHVHTTTPSWTEKPPKRTTSMPMWKPTTTTMRSTTTRRPIKTTARPTTTFKPTTEEAVTDISMPDCVPGMYYPDRNNCNAYYRCVLGELQKQYCIVGLHWNSKVNVCDWPENAKCDKENYESYPATTQTTEFTSSTEPPKDWWTPDTTTVSSTTQTTEGWWTSSTEPPKDWWTPDTTTVSSTTQTTEGWWTSSTEPPDDWWTPDTTSASSTTTVTGPSGCTNGAYYSVPGACDLFSVCVNGKLVTRSCAPGLHWNQEHQICDWIHKVQCKSKFKIGDGSTVDVDVGILSQPCQDGTYASYPGNCNQYLTCMWGSYVVFSCGSGLYWNNAEKICDWPHRVKCTPGGGSTTTEQPEDENEITGEGGVVTERPTRPPTRPPTQPAPPAPPKPSTTTLPPPPPSTPLDGYFKIVCYFTNWAWYRRGTGKYLPENIDPNLCTHIVYGFAVLDYENLVVKAHDSWADYENKFYERVVAHKKKGLKVSLAIGGWNDSQGNKYSRLVNSPRSRKKFIDHVIKFLEKYDFDGLDLDWEYPKCWQVDCSKGPDSDKSSFADFVREIHEAFRPRGLLLSAAVSPSKTVIDAGYDAPALGRYLDWVSVMTYDYHGQWDKRTGHVAPMYHHEADEFYFFNANYSINYWISQGVPRRKVILGMPLYGQSFRLANPSSHGLNAIAPGPGQAGEFTKAAGFLAYYEICDRIRNRGWTVVNDPQKRMGPYAYKGNQWVSFDDVEMIELKSEYIRRMDLGGGMIWALDLDDFKNKCGQGHSPLLSTIRRILGPAPTEEDTLITQEPQGPPTRPPLIPQLPTTTGPITQKPDSTTQSGQTEMTSWKPPSEEEFKVVCYFTNWAWYRQGLGKYLPSDIDPDLCTHIIYGFAVLNGNQGIIKPHDAWADLDNKFYEKVTRFKRRGIKVLIAIGGWNDSAGDKYSRLVSDPSARKQFISHVIKFIERHDFDGLDLDWEYPKCWQVDCNMGPDSDKPNFAAFVKELSDAFKPRGLLLSAAVSPSKRVMDAGYDIPVLSHYLDWISVMTYDFHGQWDKRTGHIAPMYLHADDVDVTFHANFSINYWISEGADRKKIVMGLPMYGQSFSLANAKENGLNAPSYGGGEAGQFTRARGFLSYYEICHNVREKNWKMVRDGKGRMGPYAHLRDQWVSFDDQEMIRHKAEYIRYMNLGGGMIWALDLDDFRNRCRCEAYPLLKTINRILRNYPGPQPVCVLDGKESEIMPERPGFGETPPPTSSGTDMQQTTHLPGTQKPPTRPTGPPTRPTRPTRPPRPTRPAKPVVPATEKPPVIEITDCKGQAFLPHPDCNKYYVCIHGKPREMRCPASLHWNKDRCDWPQNSPCKSSGGSLITSTTTETQNWWTTTSKPTATTTPQRPMSTTTTVTEEEFPGATTHSPSPVSPESDFKVVCYFTNWAWYRPGIGKYTPENIDYELCTHIAYGFASLDPNTLTIKPYDSWADLDNDFYGKVTSLKAKGLKVLIAIGGWNDSLGDKYSRLVGNSKRRRKFIETVARFIEKYGFDGLDLDWEYPKCWQVNCDAGPAEDKANFAIFVEELSAAFKARRWLLTAAVSPSKVVVDAGYEVARLSRHFDYISVMTYDFHGNWDGKTGHVAPLYYYPGDAYDYFNANFSINYWIEMGADRRKIVMGLPLYGQSFRLQNPNDHGLNAPSSGPGQAGEFTRAGGFLAFYEICERVKRQGWKVTRDPMGRMGPYAYKGNQWVSYDDVSEIKRKSRFIREMDLAGGMIWALDLDDFRNRCGCGSHPLLKTLNRELRGIGGRFSDCT